MADYFPLKRGMRLEYKYTSSEFDGVSKASIDILSVTEKGSSASADARMTVDIKGTPSSIDYKITRNTKGVITGDGIIAGGRKEFPNPPKKGMKWDEYPDANEIVSITEKVSVPGGKFTGCMKVQ